MSEPTVDVSPTCSAVPPPVSVYFVSTRQADGRPGDIYHAKAGNLAAVSVFTAPALAEELVAHLGVTPEAWTPDWSVSTADVDAVRHQVTERFGSLSIDVVLVDGVPIPLTRRAARRLLSLSAASDAVAEKWQAMGKLGPKLVMRSAIRWFDSEVEASRGAVGPGCGCC